MKKTDIRPVLDFYSFFNNAGILKSRSQLLCLVLING